MKSGVPFDVAFSLPDDDRLAWIVALGTLSGRTYDWSARAWTTPDEPDARER